MPRRKSCERRRQVSNAASLPFRLMPFCEFVAMSNCTAYDCEFVALADVERVQLVTVDRQILQEFPEVAISLDKFVRD